MNAPCLEGDRRLIDLEPPPQACGLEGRAEAPLKAKYLHLLGSVCAGSSKACGLRLVARDLLARGVHWRALVRWGQEAGCLDKYTRKLLSEILRECGIRRRKAGAGSKTPLEAMALMALVHREHGFALGNKYLLAAYRAGCALGKAQLPEARAA